MNLLDIFRKKVSFYSLYAESSENISTQSDPAKACTTEGTWYELVATNVKSTWYKISISKIKSQLRKQNGLFASGGYFAQGFSSTAGSFASVGDE